MKKEDFAIERLSKNVNLKSEIIPQKKLDFLLKLYEEIGNQDSFDNFRKVLTHTVVHFVLKYQANDDEKLYIVGSHSILGNWEVILQVF